VHLVIIFIDVSRCTDSWTSNFQWLMFSFRKQQKADQQSLFMAWLLEADRNLSVAKHASVGTGTGDLPERISWKCKNEAQKNARPTQYDIHRHSGHVTGWFLKHVLDWLVDFCVFVLWHLILMPVSCRSMVWINNIWCDSRVHLIYGPFNDAVSNSDCTFKW
jgi:hypothetical protein